MKHFYLILLTFMILLCSSCSEYRDIRVSDPEIKSVKISGLTSVDVQVGIQVKNPTKQTFTIVKLDGEFIKGEKQFATVELKEANSVPPQFEGEIPVTCTVRVTDLLDMFASGLDISSWSTDDFIAKGNVTVASSNGFRKTFHLKKTRLTDILNNSLNLK